MPSNNPAMFFTMSGYLGSMRNSICDQKIAKIAIKISDIFTIMPHNGQFWLVFAMYMCNIMSEFITWSQRLKRISKTPMNLTLLHV